MRQLVIVLFLVVPLVKAGIPPGMEDMFRQIMKDSEGGASSSEEDKGPDGGMGGGGMSMDMDAMLKMVMEGKYDMMGGGKSGDGDDDHKDKYDSSEEKDKGWHDSSEEKDKGWHDSSEEKDKGWHDSSEEKDKGSYDDDDSGEKGDYEKWMKYMKEKKEQMEHDKAEEEMKKKIMEFHMYKKMKKEKEQAMQEKKMALYKQMKMIQEKKMMTEHLYEVSMDFMKRKQAFTFDVLSRFLGFCDCHDSLDLFKKIASGRFGYEEDDYGDDGDDKGGMGDGNMPGGNGTSGGDDYGDNGMMQGFHKPSQEEMMEIVHRFLYMSHEERLKHVTHDIVKVMCGGAKQFFAHMKQVEHYLMEYKKHHYGNDH